MFVPQMAPPPLDSLVDLLAELNNSYCLAQFSPQTVEEQAEYITELIHTVVRHAAYCGVSMSLTVLADGTFINLNDLPRHLFFNLGVLYRATASTADRQATEEARTPGLALLRAYMQLQDLLPLDDLPRETQVARDPMSLN